MADVSFEVRVVPDGEGSVVELRGTVDRAAKDPLEQAYAEATGIPGEIVLDFNEVDYINSTGIAVIVGLLGLARAESRTVGAVGLTDHYREVFEITRLADFMHIYEDIPASN
jgi:anti-anti-sigma factor